MEGCVRNDVFPQAIVISECQEGDVTEGTETKGGFTSHLFCLQYAWLLELPLSENIIALTVRLLPRL
jgi:hypothetical protein